MKNPYVVILFKALLFIALAILVGASLYSVLKSTLMEINTAWWLFSSLALCVCSCLSLIILIIALDFKKSWQNMVTSILDSRSDYTKLYNDELPPLGANVLLRRCRRYENDSFIFAYTGIVIETSLHSITLKGVDDGRITTILVDSGTTIVWIRI